MCVLFLLSKPIRFGHCPLQHPEVLPWCRAGAPNKPSCKDTISNCKKIAQMGFCDKLGTMKHQCKQSCNMCTSWITYSYWSGKTELSLLKSHNKVTLKTVWELPSYVHEYLCDKLRVYNWTRQLWLCEWVGFVWRPDIVLASAAKADVFKI